MLNIINDIGDWSSIIEDVDCSNIENYINNTYIGLDYQVTPSKEEMLNAFSLCKPDKVKIVLIGNDPYPYPNVADGLCISLKKNNYVPKTAEFFKNKVHNENFNFEKYAKRGALLINTSLSCVLYDTDQNKGFNEQYGITQEYVNKHKIPTTDIWAPIIECVLTHLKSKKDLTFIFLGSIAKELCDKMKMNNMVNVVCLSHPSNSIDWDTEKVNTPSQKKCVDKLKTFFKDVDSKKNSV